jgi:hypothetical protein
MRNRSGAIALTQNLKKQMSDEAGLTQDMREDIRKEKITNYLTEKLKNDGGSHIKVKEAKDIYHIPDVPPPYLDIKKDFHTKQEKVDSVINT